MTEQDLIFFSIAGGWMLFCIIGWVLNKSEK